MHHHGENQAQRIDAQMPLSAGDFLARVVTVRPPFCGAAVFTDWLSITAACEAVDFAARKVVADAGFGPDYQISGLPHRTGHGAGLDIHEPGNMVRANTTPLAPGMCFTDEPMIAIHGEFGIRMEDCVYMTEHGPRWFTQPSPASDQPFV